MITVEHLTPLQRDALREAHRSPTQSLVRHGRDWFAHGQRSTTSGTRHLRIFTLRLVRMLDRDYLADLDDRNFPSTATLTPLGRELAEQLVAAEKAKAGAA